MKFRRKSDDKIIEVTDASAVKRFQGYPDLFEAVAVKETKSKEKE